MDERENDQEYADGWTPEARREYDEWRKWKDRYPEENESLEEYAEGQAALPPHKRDGYAERMADHADFLRKAQRENALK